MSLVVIIECGHPNPLACPNHGHDLRQLVRSGADITVEFEEDTPLAYECVKQAEYIELTDLALALLKELCQGDVESGE